LKKSSKPILFFVLVLLAAYTSLILGYVGTKLECELLVKEKFDSQKILNAKKNRRVNLLAELQFLSAEERIVKIAQEDLGMIRRTEPEMILTLSKDKVDRISTELIEKYE
jgi:cell division protein FtsL